MTAWKSRCRHSSPHPPLCPQPEGNLLLEAASHQGAILCQASYPLTPCAVGERRAHFTDEGNRGHDRDIVTVLQDTAPAPALPCVSCSLSSSLPEACLLSLISSPCSVAYSHFFTSRLFKLRVFLSATFLPSPSSSASSPDLTPLSLGVPPQPRPAPPRPGCV